MHYDTLKQLRRFRASYPIPADAAILEVGSRDVSNGSVRGLFHGSDYTGLDVQRGPGVDVLVNGSEWYLGRHYACIISCNTLEHVKDPWVLVKTMAAHLAPGGLMFIYAPFSHVYHRHPVDCYRYAPDGLRYLMELNGVNVLECYLTRSSLLVPPSYFTSLRVFLQHGHGCWLSLWRWATRQNVPHLSTVAIGRKI